eukprot:snap_masked-scaffold_52-processed-gene-1.54-mRNA-1 protein AED:0.39 eAED:0.39 QI:0/-1/0/1/-1/1/1/0/219
MPKEGETVLPTIKNSNPSKKKKISALDDNLSVATEKKACCLGFTALQVFLIFIFVCGGGYTAGYFATGDTTLGLVSDSSDAPTTTPTAAPSGVPTTGSPTLAPTVEPTQSPTRTPSQSPTLQPTEFPSASPTAAPTNSPSISPTPAPTSLADFLCEDVVFGSNSIVSRCLSTTSIVACQSNGVGNIRTCDNCACPDDVFVVPDDIFDLCGTTTCVEVPQ